MVLAAGYDFGSSLQNATDTLFGYLPNILGFLVILLVGYLIARVVKAAVNKLTEKVGVDRAVDGTPAGQFVDRISPGGKPSRLIGFVVFWILFLFVLTAAVGALQIPAVTAFMNTVLDYLPNVIAAVLIFVVAAALSAAVGAGVKRVMGDTATGRLVETVAPVLIMAIAIFMILSQLRIAPAIVQITYGALMAMLALAGGLAFGLGGRDVASRVWQAAYDSAGQAQSDVQTGAQRARAQTQSLRERAPQGQGEPGLGKPGLGEPGLGEPGLGEPGQGEPEREVPLRPSRRVASPGTVRRRTTRRGAQE